MTVKLNTELTPEMIKEGAPDEVVVSTGCKPFIPPIKGHDLPNVVQANDIFLQKAIPYARISFRPSFLKRSSYRRSLICCIAFSQALESP